MDQQPQEQPGAGAEASPKFFSNVNGVIAGITGLLVALAGLFAAYNQFAGKPAEQLAAVAPAGNGEAATPAAAAGEEPLPPSLYEGDDVKIELGGDGWTLTTKEGSYPYEEVITGDVTRVTAFNKEYDSYLRWPIDGGWAEESLNNKESWKRYAQVYPPEAPAAE